MQICADCFEALAGQCMASRMIAEKPCAPLHESLLKLCNVSVEYI